MSNCDIIVPIYNAFDAVKECIDSVLKNTDFKRAHLILIDDKSPDERILSLLKEYEKKNKDKITLLLNEKNLGFVGTVNRGMKYSKNDVLLLNSDTEVPEGWLDAIVECAYSDSMIATVTPLSNNATLASVPKMFCRNEVPNKMSVEQMSEIVKKCSLKEYPEIPTAHGFCMYIKREVLDRVGFFDEEAFGKGYGEENDFSFRCFEYGYRNVLCDNVYVLHKESQSFLDEKVDNSKALAKKHPELKNNLDYWNNIRDIREIGDNIALAVGLVEDRPNILLLVHDFSNIDKNVGGTTLHILDVINNLRSEYNFHVLSPENGIYKVHSFFKDTDVITSVYEKPVIIEPVGLYNNIYKRMIEEIVQEYKISFVHIHHMIGHFFDVVHVLKEKKIEYAVSLHDFYLESPIVSKLDEKVSKNDAFPINIDTWHQVCRETFDGASFVIAPSEFTKREYQKIYRGLKIKVINHGVNVDRLKVEGSLEKSRDIAFIGAVFPHKGSEILLGLTEKIRKVDGFKIHLFGMTTANINKRQFFVNHGMYDRKDLTRLLVDNRVALVCVFSLAPETYSYTVDEAISAGVPVVTFDIGAGAERVKKNNLGWVLEYTDDSRVILDKIKKILENKGDYNKKIQAIAKYEVRNAEEMASDYERIYKKYAVAQKLDFKRMQKKILEVSLFRKALAINCGSSYVDDYFRIINSKRWKLVSRIDLPKGIKRPLKKMYHKIRK